MNTRLEDLTPATQAAARAALALLDLRMVPHVVTSTLRSAAEQAALYAQGREPLLAVNARREAVGWEHIGAAENSGTVTNCDGRKIAEGGKGRSPHQLGTALDVVPANNIGNPAWAGASDPRWKTIAAAFKANGFEWGGDWDGWKDLPHYQLKEV